MRKTLVLFAFVLFLSAAASPTSADPGRPPLRTGTIAAAFRPTYGLGPSYGCTGTADCLPWWETCRRALAHDNGAMASIVDVRRLAGAPEARTFRIVRSSAAAFGYGATVEFWDASCQRGVAVAEGELANVSWVSFEIPAHAAWMTVTAPCTWLCTGFTGVALQWELR